MILLDSASTLTVTLAGAITTSQGALFATYVDIAADGTTYAPGVAVGNTNSATPVTWIASPAATFFRQVKYLSLYNADTAAIVATVSAGGKVLIVKALQPGERLEFAADTFTQAPAAGGGGSVAGSNKQVQYNNAGAFGAEAGFEYDAAANTLTVSNITTAGLLLTAASATGGAGLRVPHGAAPTSPTNGDVWTTTAGIYVRVNGVTVGPLGAAGSAAWGGITGTLASQTDLQAALDAKAPLAVTQNSKSAAYTLVLSDAGKHIYHPSADTTARIWTIPANSSVAFPIGTPVTFVNDSSAGAITIAITTDTLVLAGAGTTGSRTLAANGIATAIKMTSTRWQINGTGLT